MTKSEPLVRYLRRGGRAPADDESLEIASDGSFTARRTVGGKRIGRFAGRLDKTTIEELRTAVEGVAAAGDLAIKTPLDGATEVIEAGGRTGQFGSNEQPKAPWRDLVDRLRSLLDTEIIEHPVAAIELAATTRSARLRHAGAEPLQVDLASINVRAVRLDAEGAVLGRWQGRLRAVADEDTRGATSAPELVTAGSGWEQELPFRHGLELAPGDWLQVWVTLRVRDDQERAARLFVPVPAGTD